MTKLDKLTSPNHQSQSLPSTKEQPAVASSFRSHSPHLLSDKPQTPFAVGGIANSNKNYHYMSKLADLD
jgi:hypothetical protein